VCIDDPQVIPLLHQDATCVVVDKPPGLLVHRSSQSRDRQFALQTVREQIGAHVYPVHRIDRPASGVNNTLRERYGLPRLCLHAARLECAHRSPPIWSHFSAGFPAAPRAYLLLLSSSARCSCRMRRSSRAPAGLCSVLWPDWMINSDSE